MSTRPDPGGHFASDAHRRVLGALSTPEEDYGWSAVALTARLEPDEHTPNDTDVEAILGELKADGYAKSVKVKGTDVFTMTAKGFDLLTGPIADEPDPNAPVEGPAKLDVPTPFKEG